MNKSLTSVLKIEKKLFYTYAISLIIILLIFTSLLYSVLYLQNYNTNKSAQLQLLNSLEQQTDYTINNMDRSILALAINKQFRTITGSGTDQQSQYYENNNTILDIFITLDAPQFEYFRMIAFNDNAVYSFTKSGEVPSYIQRVIQDYPWTRLLETNAPKSVVIPPHADIYSTDKKIVFSVARQVPSLIDGSTTTIEIQHDYKTLQNIYNIDSNVGSILVLTKDGQLVYPMNTKPSVYQPYINAFNQRESEENHATINGTNTYFSQSDMSDWVTFIIPTSQRYNFLTLSIGIYFVITFIVLFILMLIISRYSINRLIRPLQELNESIKSVSLENLSLSITDTKTLDEFEVINQSFLDMFHQLEHSIELSGLARANEERANYLALEAQMNPHTIYNTISMIESVSYMNEDYEASELCVNFSNMLRYISDFTQRDYYITDELDHLMNYTKLIEKRYDGSLKIHMIKPDVMPHIMLPKFTLQPLVENCVQHGMHVSSKLFLVSVLISIDEDILTIVIKDNGIGFDDIKLQELQEAFREYDTQTEINSTLIDMKIGNLAIKNIYFRLKIIYGDQVDFVITNNENAYGSSVTIKINL